MSRLWSAPQVAGHLSSPPLHARHWPPLPPQPPPSPQSCTACLHGNATVFAPRPLTSQDSFSRLVSVVTARGPHAHPAPPATRSTIPVPSREGPAGPSLGHDSPWTVFLSLAVSSSRLPTHLLAWGRPRVLGGQHQPGDSGQGAVSSHGEDTAYTRGRPHSRPGGAAPLAGPAAVREHACWGFGRPWPPLCLHLRGRAGRAEPCCRPGSLGQSGPRPLHCSWHGLPSPGLLTPWPLPPRAPGHSCPRRLTAWGWRHLLPSRVLAVCLPLRAPMLGPRQAQPDSCLGCCHPGNGGGARWPRTTPGLGAGPSSSTHLLGVRARPGQAAVWSASPGTEQGEAAGCHSWRPQPQALASHGPRGHQQEQSWWRARLRAPEPPETVQLPPERRLWDLAGLVRRAGPAGEVTPSRPSEDTEEAPGSWPRLIAPAVWQHVPPAAPLPLAPLSAAPRAEPPRPACVLRPLRPAGSA